MTIDMTAAERRHLDRVASLGCLICDQPANVHHIREGQGIAQRDHFLTIPLCYDHHQGALSIHGNRRQFIAMFGTELNLLSQTIKRLEQ